MTMPGQTAGSWESRYSSACVPPVDVPIATIRSVVRVIARSRAGARMTSAEFLIGTPPLSGTFVVVPKSAPGAPAALERSAPPVALRAAADALEPADERAPPVAAAPAAEIPPPTELIGRAGATARL